MYYKQGIPEPDLRRMTTEAALRLVARGQRVSYHALRMEGLAGSAARINRIVKALRDEGVIPIEHPDLVPVEMPTHAPEHEPSFQHPVLREDPPDPAEVSRKLVREHMARERSFSRYVARLVMPEWDGCTEHAPEGPQPTPTWAVKWRNQETKRQEAYRARRVAGSR